jgi:hypothetical protein
MRNQRLWIATGVLSAMALMSLVLDRSPVAGQTAKTKTVSREEDQASVWMKGKLTNSKNILEGLTREDFALIRKNAQTMQFMGYLEGWARADVPGYKEQMHAFRFANASLVRAAEDKNLDGATLAYTQLVVSCVQCHKVVRGVPQ